MCTIIKEVIQAMPQTMEEYRRKIVDMEEMWHFYGFGVGKWNHTAVIVMYSAVSNFFTSNRYFFK